MGHDGICLRFWHKDNNYFMKISLACWRKCLLLSSRFDLQTKMMERYKWPNVIHSIMRANCLVCNWEWGLESRYKNKYGKARRFGLNKSRYCLVRTNTKKFQEVLQLKRFQTEKCVSTQGLTLFPFLPIPYIYKIYI